MGLNIDGRETERLARDLAEFTGETLADTVTTALRERLERERLARGREGLGREGRREDFAARIAAIQAEVKAIVGDAPAPDHDALLYDHDTGLPK